MQRCILDLCVFAAGKTCSNNLRCVNAFALVAHWSLLLNEVVLFALNRAEWHPLFKKGTGKKIRGEGEGEGGVQPLWSLVILKYPGF